MVSSSWPGHDRATLQRLPDPGLDAVHDGGDPLVAHVPHLVHGLVDDVRVVPDAVLVLPGGALILVGAATGLRDGPESYSSKRPQKNT